MNRFLQMSAGILGMGIFLSFLIEVNYGTDTCSFMNMAVSGRFGISFGTSMVVTNLLFFIPQVLFGRKLINIGSLMNMVLIGYISDFCRYVWSLYLPARLFAELPWRPMVFTIALIPFLISVALYMNADFGQAPYDAVPTLLAGWTKLPYIAVRIAWDFTAVLIGLLAGRTLTVGTVVLALSIGPAVSLIGSILKNPRRRKLIYF